MIRRMSAPASAAVGCARRTSPRVASGPLTMARCRQRRVRSAQRAGCRMPAASGRGGGEASRHSHRWHRSTRCGALAGCVRRRPSVGHRLIHLSAGGAALDRLVQADARFRMRAYFAPSASTRHYRAFRQPAANCCCCSRRSANGLWPIISSAATPPGSQHLLRSPPSSVNLAFTRSRLSTMMVSGTSHGYLFESRSFPS